MSGILQPVANIPLTTTTTPGILKGVKGCRFEPGLWLNTTDMYLMVMSREEQIGYPPAGFYEVPDRGEVVYITRFKPYQRSEYRTITPADVLESMGNTEVLNNLKRWRMFVFIAYQGDPPLGFMPSSNFDYRKHKIQKIAAQLSGMRQ